MQNRCSSFELCCLSFPGPVSWPICLWLAVSQPVLRSSLQTRGFYHTHTRCTFLLADAPPSPPLQLKMLSFSWGFHKKPVVGLFSFNALHFCKNLPISSITIRLPACGGSLLHTLVTALSQSWLTSPTVLSMYAARSCAQPMFYLQHWLVILPQTQEIQRQAQCVFWGRNTAWSSMKE